MFNLLLQLIVEILKNLIEIFKLRYQVPILDQLNFSVFSISFCFFDALLLFVNFLLLFLQNPFQILALFYSLLNLLIKPLNQCIVFICLLSHLLTRPALHVLDVTPQAPELVHLCPLNLFILTFKIVV